MPHYPSASEASTLPEASTIPNAALSANKSSVCLQFLFALRFSNYSTNSPILTCVETGRTQWPTLHYIQHRLDTSWRSSLQVNFPLYPMLNLSHPYGATQILPAIYRVLIPATHLGFQGLGVVGKDLVCITSSCSTGSVFHWYALSTSCSIGSVSKKDLIE